MRTKTLLLSAAALLAAGIMTSQAQPVYSQNIVGYASVATPNGGVYYSVAVPFVIGASNGLNEIFGTSLPSGSIVYTWNAGSQSYASAIYDNSQPNSNFTNALWYGSDDYTPLASIPTNAPGQGMFLVPYAPVTNTFAGTVAVNIGTSNHLVMPNGGVYYLVSPVIPYAGAVTNGTSSNGGANLNNLPSGTIIYTWDAVSQSYVSTIYDNSQPNSNFPNALWYGSDDYTPAPVPTLSVGEPFFIVPYGPYTWTTGL